MEWEFGRTSVQHLLSVLKAPSRPRSPLDLPLIRARAFAQPIPLHFFLLVLQILLVLVSLVIVPVLKLILVAHPLLIGSPARASKDRDPSGLSQPRCLRVRKDDCKWVTERETFFE